MSGEDFKNMCESFHRAIEAHHDSKNPFHSPINADAVIALRVLRGMSGMPDEIATLRARLAAAESEVERLQNICRPKEYKTSGTEYHEDLVRNMGRDTLVREHIRLLRDYFHRCNMYFELERIFEKLRASTKASRRGEVKP